MYQRGTIYYTIFCYQRIIDGGIVDAYMPYMCRICVVGGKRKIVRTYDLYSFKTFAFCQK